MQSIQNMTSLINMRNTYCFRRTQQPISNSGYVRRNISNNERRSSLPPLQKNSPRYKSIDKLEKDMGGETSGYGSDNHHSPEVSHPQTWNNHNAGYESSSSYRDDRLKWGDRGVGLGKFWGQKEFNDYDKSLNSDTPGWVKRGLERQGELIVANSSPAESPEQDFGENERPCTGSTFSQQR